MQKVIGLAGHIDHGKTALVKALTGVDTDSLEEEKRRGVTIDIGIAFYNDEVTFIDVPGHERFIKNMVTGVSTVDAALLVIAADDGVMPQTREHLDILHLLGIEKLIVALNKSDLVDPEWLELVREEVSEFLAERGYPGVRVIPVSAVLGTGIEDLRSGLDELIASIQSQDTQSVFRLPIDRVFSVKGFGTVVTGTVLSHELRKGQSVELFPQQITYSVRGLQSHHRDVDKIQFGDRGAINLGGASVEELGRGAFIGSPGLFQTGFTWLGLLKVLPHWERSIKEADRVHVHVGTGKREARIHLLQANHCDPGQSMLVQLMFDEPVSASFLERVVLRYLSVQSTLGGATLYWAVDKRIKKNEERLGLLKDLPGQDLKTLIETSLQFFQRPLTRRSLARYLSVAESKIHPIIQRSKDFKVHQEEVLSARNYDEGLREISSILAAYHQTQPLGKGLNRDQLGSAPAPIREFILSAALAEGVLRNQGDLWQLAEHLGELNEADKLVKARIISMFETEAFAPPTLQELQTQLDVHAQTVLQWMIQQGDLVRIDKDFYLLRQQLEHFLQALRSWFRAHAELSISEAREIIPTTRKFLLPMLNYAERKALLIRDGDIRRWVGEELG